MRGEEKKRKIENFLTKSMVFCIIYHIGRDIGSADIFKISADILAIFCLRYRNRYRRQNIDSEPADTGSYRPISTGIGRNRYEILPAIPVLVSQAIYRQNIGDICRYFENIGRTDISADILQNIGRDDI